MPAAVRGLTGENDAAHSRAGLRLAVTAVGAIVTAFGELAIARVVPSGAPAPGLVLVMVVTVAVAGGIEAAVVASVAGGLALDVVAFRPLGMTAVALLLVAAATIAAAAPLRGTARAAAAAMIVPAAILGGVWAAGQAPTAVTRLDASTLIVSSAGIDAVVTVPAVVLGLLLRRQSTKEAAPSR